MNQLLEELSNKIWDTKNARFNAYRRMKRSQYSSTASIALSSFFIIAINLIEFMPECRGKETLITILTIILSTFVLVLSLMINQLQYDNRGKNYHSCGIELDKLNQEIKLQMKKQPGPTYAEEKDLSYKYYKILQKYNLNHIEIDHKRATKCESGWWKSFIYWLRWYIFDVNTLYWLIPISIASIIFYIIR